MATPGVKPTISELEKDEALPSRFHTAFRGAAARGNYLAADRLDAQDACKESVDGCPSRQLRHGWLRSEFADT